MSKELIALILFIFILVSFARQRWPSGLTAIVGSALMMVFGIISPAQMALPFGSDTVLMVASVLILGNAVFETGAASKIGAVVVKYTGKSETGLVVALAVSTALLSAFLSNSAVVAIFLPLLASLARSSNGRITKKGTYMAVGIASVVGGNCTLAGSTPQMTAQAILLATPGVRELTFWELGKVGFPLVALLALYYAFIGIRLQHKVFDFPELPDSEPPPGAEQTQSRARQTIVLLIMLGCVAGFTTGILSFGAVAAVSALLCIVTGCISFERAYKTLDWNTICVLGGAMGISTALNESGVVSLMARLLIIPFGGADASPVIISTVLLIFSAGLGNVMSHTATAAILTPIAISLGQSLGVDPIAYVICVVVGCNLAFATPVATPPLTMTLVGGYRFRDYAKVGGIYNILSLILAAVIIPPAYGLV